MISKNVLKIFSQQADREVRSNILPFWLKLVDETYGGFFGEVAFSGEIRKEAAKGSILCSRILWTFSHAYIVYQEPTFLSAARHAYQFLIEKFLDHEHGGTYWSVDYKGVPLDTRKLILPQSFAIYSLSEYYLAVKEPQALALAIELFGLIEAHGHDPLYGGYLDGFDQSWSPIEPEPGTEKGFDPQLRVLMAYINLLRAWDSPLLRQKLSELVDIFLDHLIDPLSFHLILFQSKDWKPSTADFSYGHDIELVWLLSEVAGVLRDGALRERIQPLLLRMAEMVYQEGLDTDGAVFDKAGPQGLLDEHKIWWPQAESVIGFLNAFQISGEEKYFQASYKNWMWIQSALVDHQHGDWYAQLTRDRLPVEGRNLVDLWKCPYHNSRCCFEIQKRVAQLTSE